MKYNINLLYYYDNGLINMIKSPLINIKSKFLFSLFSIFVSSTSDNNKFRWISYAYINNYN